MAILKNLRTAWNAFRQNEQNRQSSALNTAGNSYGVRPDRVRFGFQNERSIVTSVYNRIAVDVADVDIRHVTVDENELYVDTMKTELNKCLTLVPNMDQYPRSFKQDIVMSLFDAGTCVIVPVDTIGNPVQELDFDVYSLRVGRIVQWYSKHVKVSLYNEDKGSREDITLEKRYVAIVENPLYAVMNEPNSTLQRLIRKLSLLDGVDEQTSSGKLDLIIQLPYVVKSETRKAQAEQRRKDIEFQLKGSQYGIAYTDGTEKITQLNRPAENNLLEQIKTLQQNLYDQLGITPGVMNGQASEAEMLNYHNRTVAPILQSICESMGKAFLGTRYRNGNERIKYFRDPFKYVPMEKFGDLADKLIRNEVASSNELRAGIGLKPSKDPKADQLRNPNMPDPMAGQQGQPGAGPSVDEMDSIMNEIFDGLTADIDKLSQGG